MAQALFTYRKETYTQVLYRMLEKARDMAAQGNFMLVTIEATGEWVCTTRATHRAPWNTYHLSPYGCTCPGFEKFAYCKHYAAYLYALGELPPLDPEPAAALPVPGSTIAAEDAAGELVVIAETRRVAA